MVVVLMFWIIHGDSYALCCFVYYKYVLTYCSVQYLYTFVYVTLSCVTNQHTWWIVWWRVNIHGGKYYLVIYLVFVYCFVNFLGAASLLVLFDIANCEKSCIAWEQRRGRRSKWCSSWFEAKPVATEERQEKLIELYYQKNT